MFESDCEEDPHELNDANIARGIKRHSKNLNSNLNIKKSKSLLEKSKVLNTSAKDSMHLLRDNSPKVAKTVVKRKFPGPAGLLPERNESFQLSEQSENSISEEVSPEILSSQEFDAIYPETWNIMIEEFKHFTSKMKLLTDDFNIRLINTLASNNHLINTKIPFLALIIKEISRETCVINMVLKDKTGKIQGTILRNLYEKYKEDLAVNSVIVLKNVSVLNQNNPTLVITNNNLVSIYAGKDAAKNSEGTDGIRKVAVQPLDENEIVSKLEFDAEVRQKSKSICDIDRKENQYSNDYRPLYTKLKTSKSDTSVAQFNSCKLVIQKTNSSEGVSNPLKIVEKSNHERKKSDKLCDISSLNPVDDNTDAKSIMEGIDFNDFFGDF